MLLYLCSTLVHSITYKPAKDIFEIMDHSAIYVLIAGTYTPFSACHRLRGTTIDPVQHNLGPCACRYCIYDFLLQKSLLYFHFFCTLPWDGSSFLQ
ncbi:hemolysin III family protein [Paenibacillus larvae]|nr:hemolysin III family protein [Paenibacillus larvae]